MHTPSLVLTNHTHNIKVAFLLYGEITEERRFAEQRLLDHRAEQLNVTREPAKSLPMPYRAPVKRSDFDDEFDDVFDGPFQSTGR